MDKENKKILTLSFVIFGFLVAVVARVLLETLAAGFGVVARYYTLEAVKHGIPVGLGFLSFVLLQFNKRVLTWADEVVSEIRKIVWPSQKDTSVMTMVCCVMLLVAGVILGLFDITSRALVDLILG